METLSTLVENSQVYGAFSPESNTGLFFLFVFLALKVVKLMVELYALQYDVTRHSHIRDQGMYLTAATAELVSISSGFFY